MRGVVFFDHLNAGAAVLGNLIYVGTFQKPKTDVGVSKAIGRPPTAFTVELQIILFENCIELLFMIGREHEIGRCR